MEEEMPTTHTALSFLKLRLGLGFPNQKEPLFTDEQLNGFIALAEHMHTHIVWIVSKAYVYALTALIPHEAGREIAINTDGGLVAPAHVSDKLITLINLEMIRQERNVP